MRLPETVGLLNERNYRRLFIGQSVSLLGDGITPVALAFAVLGLTGSVADLGFVLGARLVAVVALILAGGVYADRVSPRTAMLVADVVRLVAMAAMAALLISGVAEIWELAVLYAVQGGGSALFTPASGAINPSIVSAQHLQQANALLAFARSIGNIAGPAIAGVLLAIASPGWAIGLDSLTFAVSAAFLALIKVQRQQRAERSSFVSELRQGWSEFRSRTWIWAFILGFSLVNVLGLATWNVLGPEIARRSLGGSGAWAVLAAGLGVGALLGSVLALRITPRYPLRVAPIGALLAPIPLILLAITGPILAIAVAIAAAEATFMLSDMLWETTLQQYVRPEALARVTAFDWFGSLVLMPIGYAVVGPIAEAIGFKPTLFGASGGLVLIAVFLFAVPSIRSVEASPRIPDRRAVEGVLATRAIEPD